MRCLALAMEWKRQDGKVIFITHCEHESLLKRITDSGMEVINIEAPHPDPRDLERTLVELNRLGNTSVDKQNNWIVLDGYHFDPDYQRTIKDSGWKILVIDDMAHHSYYHADIILNQNIGADQFGYDCDPETNLLLGPEYVLLRPEFEKWRIWKRPIKQQPENLLVTLGAGDPGDVAFVILEALEHDGLADLNVRFVIGPAWNPGDDFLSKVAPPAPNIQFVYDAPNMPELMAWADLAISAAGSSCWELCFMGIPSLLFVLADNQKCIGQGLEELGIAANMGDAKLAMKQVLIEKVNNIVSNFALRANMVKQGQKLVDGKGAGRVCSYLGLLPLKLRHVTKEDAKLLFQWANDPEVRQRSFSSDNITWIEHLEWLNKLLQDTNCIHYIATTYNGVPVGQIRYSISGKEAEVHLSIEKASRGMGLAKWVLELGRMKLKQTSDIEEIHAFVKSDNPASIKAFLAACFEKIDEVYVKGYKSLHLVSRS